MQILQILIALGPAILGQQIPLSKAADTGKMDRGGESREGMLEHLWWVAEQSPIPGIPRKMSSRSKAGGVGQS